MSPLDKKSSMSSVFDPRRAHNLPSSKSTTPDQVHTHMKRNSRYDNEYEEYPEYRPDLLQIETEKLD